MHDVLPVIAMATHARTAVREALQAAPRCEAALYSARKSRGAASLKRPCHASREGEQVDRILRPSACAYSAMRVNVHIVIRSPSSVICKIEIHLF